MNKLIRNFVLAGVVALSSALGTTPALAATTNQPATHKCSAGQHAVTRNVTSGGKTTKRTVCVATKNTPKKQTVKKSSTATTTENKKLAQQNANTTTYKGKGKATAVCKDGTDSYAVHHQGECSQHGGVQKYL